MAARGDIKAGRAFVELYLKSSLNRGLLAAKQQLQNFGNAVTKVGTFFASLGAAITTPLAAAVAHFTKFGSELNDVAARTGVSTSSLAELKFAAEQTGAGLEDVEAGLRKMAKGGHDVNNFDQVAADITAIADPSERAARAMEIFGKSGTKLLPMLADLARLRQEARDSGLVPTEESVAAADRIGDAFDRLRSIVMAAVFNIGGALAPVLEPALEMATNIAKAFNRWSKENGSIIRSIALIGGGLLAAGTILLAVGAAITGLGTAFGIAAGAVATTVGLLTSPLALVLAALVAGAVAWVRFTDSGKAAAKGVIDALAPVLDTLRSTVKGIGDALAAGDLALAAQVAWAGIKLAWHQGTQDINRMWLDAKFFFLSVWEEAKTGVAKLFISAFAGIQRVWVETVSFLESIWNRFSTTIANGWQSAQKTAGNLLIDAAEKSGAVSNDFAQAWRESLNEPIDAAIASRTDRSGEQQADIERRRKESLDRINADETGARQILEGDKQRAQDDLGRQREADLAAKQKALDDARAALNAARAKAAEAAEATKAAGGGPGIAPPAAEILKAATSTFSTGGAIALGFGASGGGPQERMARAAETTVKKLDVLHADITTLKDKLAMLVPRAT